METTALAERIHMEGRQLMIDNGFEQIFPLGEPKMTPTRNKSPGSYLAQLTDGSVPVSNVTFEPGCRNYWHIFHDAAGGGDQILLCTSGSGWYQAEGEDSISKYEAKASRAVPELCVQAIH
ncbi:hypothetical protein ACFT1A_29505 [Rhodococcus sp. NPDC057135]|uniref:hypothetical protein n=1 Tax=Rhodococcus sp. NPDC057135 TaxID=3346028 RepID=UPI003639A610